MEETVSNNDMEHSVEYPGSRAFSVSALVDKGRKAGRAETLEARLPLGHSNCSYATTLRNTADHRSHDGGAEYRVFGNFWLSTIRACVCRSVHEALRLLELTGHSADWRSS